jgi:hypothetical protein
MDSARSAAGNSKQRARRQLERRDVHESLSMLVNDPRAGMLCYLRAEHNRFLRDYRAAPARQFP